MQSIASLPHTLGPSTQVIHHLKEMDHLAPAEPASALRRACQLAPPVAPRRTRKPFFCLVIGQSPRPDLTQAVAAAFQGHEILVAGALDGIPTQAIPNVSDDIQSAKYPLGYHRIFCRLDIIGFFQGGLGGSPPHHPKSNTPASAIIVNYFLLLLIHIKNCTFMGYKL